MRDEAAEVAQRRRIAESRLGRDPRQRCRTGRQHLEESDDPLDALQAALSAWLAEARGLSSSAADLRTLRSVPAGCRHHFLPDDFH
jgi:hypothetical protein